MVKDLCFEVIEKCLNNCKFCSSNSDCNKSRIISFDDFKRVIDYFMKNGGIEELSISGGEPFLHPDLVNMVSYAKSLGIRTVIFTSGVVYNEGLSDEEMSNEERRPLFYPMEMFIAEELAPKMIEEKILKFVENYK